MQVLKKKSFCISLYILSSNCC